jgi:hypothetical protein
VLRIYLYLLAAEVAGSDGVACAAGGCCFWGIDSK